MKSPIELLWIIIDKAKYDKVNNCLAQHGVNNQLTLMAKGTAKSMIGDIFSFGVLDRDVICAIVDTHITDTLCADLDKIINPHGPTGVIFVTPLDAISSDLYRMVKGDK